MIYLTYTYNLLAYINRPIHADAHTYVQAHSNTKQNRL